MVSHPRPGHLRDLQPAAGYCSDEELKCIPGFAMDLTTVDEQGRPWDFDDEATRERARAIVVRDKPMLLVGSPMCTAYSAWQHINRLRRDSAIVKKELDKARVHLAFCCELYQLQQEGGR